MSNRKQREEKAEQERKPKDPTSYAFCPQMREGMQVHLKICQIRCAHYMECPAREEAEVALTLAGMPHDFSLDYQTKTV